MGMQWLSSSVRWALIGVASGGLVGVLAATAVAEEGELITGAQAAEDAGTITPSSAKNQPAQEGIARAPSPATTVGEWLAQMEAAIIEITGVRVERSETGLQVILETADGDLSAPTTETVGNALIAEIPNAVLALPEGEEFQQANPAEGIARVSVTAVGQDRIQVAITGTNAPPEATVSAEAGNLVWTVVPGIAQADDTDDAIEIMVTGEREVEGYYVPEASVGTRTETPIRDIPQSVQVVPGQVIREQRTNTLIEALQNVPGVSQGAQSTRGLFNNFLIRGFNASDNILRNGVADPSFSILGYDPSWIEQIEVLRGPASVLFGTGSLGGTVNLVGKRPLDEPFYELGVSVGSFDYYRGTADLSGPLNPEGTVLGRLNVAVESNGTFVDFFDTQRYVVTPALTWRINDRATLNFDAQYFRLDKPFDTGLPARGTILPNPEGEIPRNRFLGDFASSDDSEAYRVGLDFDYQFSDNWQLRSVFNASFLRLDRFQYFTRQLQPDNRTITRGYLPDFFSEDFYNFDSYIIGDFKTGSFQHQLVAGVNLSRSNAFNRFSIGDAPPIDVFNPVYNQPVGPTTLIGDLSSQIDILGVYLQDQIAFSDNLKLVLGGRFDIASFSRIDRLNETMSSKQYESFSPRVGLVYQPIEPLSLYASFSRSFEVTASLFTATPTPEPEFGTQYEAGIKADISDRLAATLAFYNLTRTNIPTPDPNDPALTLLVGEQRSRGLDFNLTGEVLPGWNLIIGYALTDARIAEDNRFDVGNFINNVPLHSFNLWSTYEIQDGLAEGLGFGLGLVYVGDRQGDLANTFEIPSYLRTDAAIFYDRENFRAALNFRNLFDVDYIESSVFIDRVFPGAPFTVIGSLSWEF